MPVEISVKLSHQGIKALRALGPARAVKAIERGRELVALSVLREVMKNSGPPFFERRTGTLSRSWRFLLKPGRAVFFNLARTAQAPHRPYAAFLEFGTRSHWVFPRHKKALRWRLGGKGPVSAFRAGKGAASFGFSKGHYVLGINPRLMFRRTWEGHLARKEPGRLMAQAINDEFTKGGGS